MVSFFEQPSDHDSKIKKEITALQAKIDETNEKTKIISSHKDDLKNQIALLTLKLESEKDESVQLRGEIDQKQIEFGKLNEKLVKVEQLSASYKQDLENMKQKITDVIEEESVFNKEKNQLEYENYQLEKTKNELTTVVDASNVKIIELQRQIDESKENESICSWCNVM